MRDCDARHRPRVAVGALVVFAALALAACSSPRTASTTIPTVKDDVSDTAVPSFYSPPRPLPQAPAGTIIRAEVVTGVPGIPPDAKVWRVLYHSRSIYGADIAESGYVVAPAGRAPAGGRPILSWAHGTTGFGAPCAPSLLAAQGGLGIGPYLVPGLADFLSRGFVIAATDYEGLGVSGVHPYLLGKSEGQAVLDAARAARRLPGLDTSRTVVIYGHSQGGHAALFAGELAPSYAPELHVVGVVAAAPATNLSTIVSVATTPTTGQSILIFTLPTAYGWTKTYRDLPSSDVFTPTGAQIAASVVPGQCVPAVSTAISAQHLTPAAIFQPDAPTNPVVVAHARLNDPGRVRTPAPMLVVQGTADMVVPPALTDSYVGSMACPVGDRIDYVHMTGATHGSVVQVDLATVEQWIADRLHGTEAPTTCGEPGDVTTVSP